MNGLYKILGIGLISASCFGFASCTKKKVKPAPEPVVPQTESFDSFARPSAGWLEDEHYLSNGHIIRKVNNTVVFEQIDDVVSITPAIKQLEELAEKGSAVGGGKKMTNIKPTSFEEIHIVNGDTVCHMKNGKILKRLVGAVK